MPNIVDQCAEQLKPLKGEHNDQAATAVIGAMLSRDQLRSELARSNPDSVMVILNRASKIRFPENTLAEPVFRRLGVDAVVDRIAPKDASVARRTSSVLNAASHAGNHVCTEVLKSLVTRRAEAFKQVLGSEEPRDIAMAMNAAAHAEKNICLHVARRAVNEQSEKFKALMEHGDPHHVALALSASANAGEDICDLVLNRNPIGIERVMAQGSSQDVAMALKAALRSSDPARHCREAFGNWMQHHARQPDQLSHMTAYQASIWTEALVASRLSGVPDAPHLDEARRELHRHVGAFQAADAAWRKHPYRHGSKELRATRLGNLANQCSQLSDGRHVVDLHHLHHHIAEDVIRHVLSTTPPNALPVFIAGRGSHRVDGTNPMADLVDRLCMERGLVATQDPSNPGRLLVESGAAPHMTYQQSVPPYAQILAQTNASSSSARSAAPHLDEARRELHRYVGAFQVADAAWRNRLGTKELRYITLRNLANQCSQLPDGRRVVDLHHLPHDVAGHVIRHVLLTTPRDALPVFIAGRGSHPVDGTNPMADLVDRLCREIDLKATQDPRNPGRLLVESGAAPHMAYQGDVPPYQQLLDRMNASSYSAQGAGTAQPASHTSHTRHYGPPHG